MEPLPALKTSSETSLETVLHTSAMTLRKIALRKIASVSALVMAQVSLSACSLSASAQSLPLLQNFSSRDLTDAVTQGFRESEPTFFTEGNQAFERIIKHLQEPQRTPVLIIEPADDQRQSQLFIDEAGDLSETEPQ